MNIDVLDRLTLNRALLARQSLLQRERSSAEQTIERLVGMQSQKPEDPYIGLWTRLADFRHEELGELIADRRAVRASLIRATIHLVTARDYVRIRPVLYPVFERSVYSNADRKRELEGVDTAAVLATGRTLMEEEPLTQAELRDLLAPEWPNRDATALAFVNRMLHPLVHVPPRGIWGENGPVAMTTAENWLGERVSSTADSGMVDELVLRYLAAFGPATAADARTWSGLPGLGDVMERLRPQLRTFRDTDGRELFDVPDAPLPDSDIHAPPRFLPEFDNALLSHADRSRILPPEHRQRVISERSAKGTVLIDGFVSGFWRLERTRDAATLRIEPFESPSGEQRAALSEEGNRLLAFAASDAAEREIEFTDVE
ncbi:winged helix DNA-binding domain-containing protein [Haladaptatus sp. DYF46]|uniref:winged helix DNA-binding domain-containing protein n=1 Tax=Haladaptatus sp. DYF46 TaxID=2886041 RepID=UPI001E606399|nr:winged helix DNA-binding domain-containing protein [Haladaptatus sp. DYF46]